jgi:hypothetical protein
MFPVILFSDEDCQLLISYHSGMNKKDCQSQRARKKGG